MKSEATYLVRVRTFYIICAMTGAERIERTTNNFSQSALSFAFGGLYTLNKD